MPTPMTSSASSTLTAAMMPRMRFVVPRLPVMAPSERRGLTDAVARRLLLRSVAERFVQELPPFVRNAGRALHRRAEAVQLAREVVERRLELTAKRSSMFCEEQIPGYGADDRAADRRKHYARVIHTRLPPNVARSFRGSSCVPRTSTCERRGVRGEANAAPLDFRTVGLRYVVAAEGEFDAGGVEGDAAARADLPASRMSCFFILL